MAAGGNKKVCLDNSCRFVLVTREEWGARPPKEEIEKQRYSEPLSEVYKRIVLHHTSAPKSNSGLPSAISFLRSIYTDHSAVQELQKYFMLNRGFDDIGVHFYIDENGTVYEGRKLEYVGAHAGSSIEANETHNIRLDPDFGSIGIDVAGCFDTTCEKVDMPSAEQVLALGALLTYLQKMFPGITKEQIMGHKEVYEKVMKPANLTPRRKDNETACPGDRLMNELDLVKKGLK